MNPILQSRLKFLLKAKYLLLRRDVQVGEYAFDYRGFPYEAIPDRFSYGAFRAVNLGFGQVYQRDQFSNTILLGLQLTNAGSLNLFPKIIAMSEDSARRFIQKYPDRKIVCYLLLTPISATIKHETDKRLNCEASAIIFTTTDNLFINFKVEPKYSSLTNSQKSLEDFAKLTTALQDDKFFLTSFANFEASLDKIWQGVEKFMKRRQFTSFILDKEKGLLLTNLAEEGLGTLKSRTRIALLVEKGSDSLTNIAVKVFSYSQTRTKSWKRDFDSSDVANNVIFAEIENEIGKDRK
ncbi:MAG: hypothetical protein V1799_15340 [bacterium]